MKFKLQGLVLAVKLLSVPLKKGLSLCSLLGTGFENSMYCFFSPTRIWTNLFLFMYFRQCLRERIYCIHDLNQEYKNVYHVQKQNLYLKAAACSYLHDKLNFWANQTKTYKWVQSRLVPCSLNKIPLPTQSLCNFLCVFGRLLYISLDVKTGIPGVWHVTVKITVQIISLIWITI